jgi:transposase
MDYFAGLDVSMEETHVCVVDRDRAVIHEVKVPSTPADIKTALAGAPACRRVVFETGTTRPLAYGR